MRRGALFALVPLVLGLLVIGLAFAAGSDSVEDYLEERCRDTGTERDPNGSRARSFRCEDPPARLAADLADQHKPADRRSTPAGHFLRYDDEMVGIVAATGRESAALQGGGEGGRSKALLSDERNGYGFFYPYVGGFWGTYRGRGESFRGGGPGAGK